MFIFGGCGNNDNNFRSYAECQKHCGKNIMHIFDLHNFWGSLSEDGGVTEKKYDS